MDSSQSPVTIGARGSDALPGFQGAVTLMCIFMNINRSTATNKYTFKTKLKSMRLRRMIRSTDQVCAKILCI